MELSSIRFLRIYNTSSNPYPLLPHDRHRILPLSGISSQPTDSSLLPIPVAALFFYLKNLPRALSSYPPGPRPLPVSLFLAVRQEIGIQLDLIGSACDDFHMSRCLSKKANSYMQLLVQNGFFSSFFGAVTHDRQASQYLANQTRTVCYSWFQ